MARVNDRAILAAFSCWLAAGLASILPAQADCPSGKLFFPASTYSIANFPSGLIARDINGDGIQDLVVSVADFAGDASRITVRLGSGTGGVWDGSFEPDANYAVGLRPGAVIMADFDKDGIQDLAALSLGDGTLRILLGHGASGIGDGAFSDPISFPTAPYASHLASGDFDHDGILDLAVLILDPAELLILMGGGAGGVWDGTFGAPSTEPLPPGIQPRRVIVSNFNGDGIADLAVLEVSYARMAVLIGSGSAGIGDGDFAAPVEYTAGTYNSSSAQDLAAADVNSDGIIDILVTTYGTIESFFGNGSGGVGDGTFASGPSFPAAFGSVAMVLDDFDLDGILDVATAGGEIVAVFRGRGNGGVGDGLLLPPTGYAVGEYPSSIAVTDFNGDGVPDLAVADSYPSQISILVSGCPPLPAPMTGVWADGGVPVCTAPGEQTDVTIIPDGAGGALHGETFVRARARTSTPRGSIARATRSPAGSPMETRYARTRPTRRLSTSSPMELAERSSRGLIGGMAPRRSTPNTCSGTAASRRAGRWMD